MKNFRTFNLAVAFYQQSRLIQITGHLKEQLNRAASSIVLNLAEGRGKSSSKDQTRFFQIAFGSLRECQAILILAELQNSNAWNKLDEVGAALYCLIKNAR